MVGTCVELGYVEDLTKLFDEIAHEVLSVSIDDGAPYLQMISSYRIRASSLASVDFIGKASGHLENASTTKRMYLCPSLVLVKGPRKSI